MFILARYLLQEQVIILAKRNSTMPKSKRSQPLKPKASPLPGAGSDPRLELRPDSPLRGAGPLHLSDRPSGGTEVCQ
jgi:hypothetical protein